MGKKTVQQYYYDKSFFFGKLFGITINLLLQEWYLHHYSFSIEQKNSQIERICINFIGTIKFSSISILTVFMFIFYNIIRNASTYN